MAGKQLKDFPAASALADADVLFASQGGAEKALSAAQVAAYIDGKRFSQTLLGWAAVQAFIGMSSIVRDANGVLLSANVVWPDGTAGVWATDAVNATTPVIDAWHATYLGATTKTVTQTAVTRDANGAVTAQPAITIS